MPFAGTAMMVDRVFDFSTTCGVTADWLASKWRSPEYIARIAWTWFAPTRAAVKLAYSSCRAEEPSSTSPSKNDTVPLDGTIEFDETNAVNVTGWPFAEG